MNDVRLASLAPRMIALAAALTGGCGPGPNDNPPDMSHGPWVLAAQLGGIADALQPESAWIDFVDGQEATLTEGAQGGFHVWMKLRVSGDLPDHFTMNKTAHRVSDEKLVLRAMQTLQPMAGRSDAGYWELPTATPMFMCPSPIGISVIDEKIRFEVSLTDDGGNELGSAHVTLVPRCPTLSSDSLMFCKRICTG